MMGAWIIKAEGGQACADQTHVLHALSILFAPGDWHEIRALPSGRGRIVQVDDLADAFAAVELLADEQVYYCLNPIGKGAERANKISVVCRRWFLIDVDTVKPKDVSSTEEEKIRALVVVGTVFDYLTSLGWPAPLMVDSGNGWHLLYRVDLPNDKFAQQLLKSCLYVLAERFKGNDAIVDVSTHDAPRVSKLPGTMARKGPDTPDRPHRMARIYIEPTQIDVVPTSLLQALGSPSEEKPAKTNGVHRDDPWFAKARDGHGLASYVRGAIERECFKVALAPPGERNTILNTAAFNLGTMAGWSEMSETSARGTLQLAAERAGLLERETLITIASGWKAGTAQPRQRPQETSKPIVEMGKLTIGLDEIIPEKIDWIWENIVAPGFFSLFAGRTGMGKSFVVCDLVARLSRGESPAFSALKRKPMRTLFISEDPPNIMLGPRLIELKADKKMVRFMRYEAMSIWTLADLKMLEKTWQESGRPDLIVIDPPSNFLGDIDEHKNAALRGVLMPIVAWLGANRVACIMITHINKQVGKGIDAVGRIMGSVAWASTARVTMAFDKDPETAGQHLMGASKNNLGPLAPTLAYRIVKTESLATIEWVGPVDTDADAMINQTKKSRRVTAAEFLDEQFRLKRCWASDELIQLARDAGVSRNALFEAKGDLPIRAKQVVTQDGIRLWEWQAQDGWPKASVEKAVETLGTLGRCVGKSNDGNDLLSVPMSSDRRDSEKRRDSERSVSKDLQSTESGIVSKLLFDKHLDSQSFSVPEANKEEVETLDLTSALRWLSGMVTRTPIARSQFVVLANGVFIEESDLDQAALVLKMVRTFEEGIELWSLP